LDATDYYIIAPLLVHPGMFAFSFFTFSLVDDTMVQQAVRKGQPAPPQETAGTADEVTQ
jgi:hypothetical protein